MHFKIEFSPVIAKLNFQHPYSSLQCHMILQKSFGAQETFILFISIENSCTALFCHSLSSEV